MNSFVNDVFEWIASEVSKLTSYNNVDLGLKLYQNTLKFLPFNNFGSPQKLLEKTFQGHFQQSLEVFGKSLETLL